MGGLFGICGLKVDAVKYYLTRIAKQCEKINRMIDLRVTQNSGVGVVTFLSRLQVSRCIYNQDFYDLVQKKCSLEDKRFWNVYNWKISKAPSQSEIIWENLFKNEYESNFKSLVLLTLLLAVCIVLVTPLILV